ncbi:hypothetical protein EPA93_04835 [Ktedonosporobacter rubrisoli]|uniref:HAD family hydrolase n=1 Tax=Ktedonosporobacter rubrisoli TaxID=2509675 RepID=A0A4V0YY87_KTERU|nr:hypothetical protein [Ktedonosporobacter rubrisoli]QBD75361.1 hypothetical protein EPA93_04835 [Ktedonosporobacter rubrisoli]
MQNIIARLKSQLAQQSLQGLALDIDETLSYTNGYWIEQMQALFGNPEQLSIQETIEKYRYTHRVPYWQTAESTQWMEEQRHSNAAQECLPLIENADLCVNIIHRTLPIVLYATIRPEEVKRGTSTWLKKHGFPEAEILARPAEVPYEEGNRWKAQAIAELFPQVVGIVDDNPEMLAYLPAEYQGTVFLYNSHSTSYPKGAFRVLHCSDWPSVCQHVDILGNAGLPD